MEIMLSMIEIHAEHSVDSMGKFLSNETTYAIDVSGNNNYVLMFHVVPINLSVILQNITQHIMEENQKSMIHITIISMIVTMILTISIMIILLSYTMKWHRISWEMLILETIQQDLSHH